MIRTATARSAANIAFIKYWGATDLDNAIPANPSLSMTLSECASRCTVRPHPEGDAAREDRVLFRPPGAPLAPADEGFASRVRGHLQRLRQRMGREGYVEVATENRFPAAAGLASSASGFSALALAASAAFDDVPDARELSVRARLSGSGSATRSAMGGYVLWPDDPPGPDCPAVPAHGADHWALADVIAVVHARPKRVSSLDGHRRATSSPHFATRQRLLPDRFRRMRAAVDQRDWPSLAELLEEEAIELHLIAMSSRPAIFYWEPATLSVWAEVRRLREGGVPAACTMDAGANVHVICPADRAPEVATALRGVVGVIEVISDGVGDGPTLVDDAVD